MSNCLNACENDQRPIHSQPDAPCAGELGNAQCDQVKDSQPSSQHPWRWTAQTADQTVYGTTTLANNFCERCQNIFDILTRVLLCWDEIPPMWAAARFTLVNSWKSRSPKLHSFYVSFGGICLTMTTDCRFCTFFAQIIRSTLQREGIDQQKEIVILINMANISKAEPQPDADDAHKGTTRWRKALGFGIYDAKCAAVLPPPGTVFLRDEFEKNPIYINDYFLVSVESAVRIIDTDDVATQQINSHRTDSTESHISIGLPRLRPAFADPNRFVTWLQACEQLHGKRCTEYRRVDGDSSSIQFDSSTRQDYALRLSTRTRFQATSR